MTRRNQKTKRTKLKTVSHPLINLISLYHHWEPAEEPEGTGFLTGILVCVLSIMNIAYRIPFDNSPDISWNAIPVYTICVAEVNIGIAVSCMPVLTPLFNNKTFSSMRLPSFRYFRSLRSRTNTKESTRADHLPSSQEDLTRTGPRFVRGDNYLELQDAKNNSNGEIRSTSINSEV